MAFVFAAAAKALKLACATREFECAFHAHLLAGCGDFALEGAPVAVAIGALVAPIPLLNTAAIDQIGCAPVGDIGPVPQRIGRFLGSFHFDKRKGMVVLVEKRRCSLGPEFSGKRAGDFSRHVRLSFSIYASNLEAEWPEDGGKYT